MQRTHDELPPEAQRLMDAGKPIRLYDWTNCAFGTTGYYVTFLERAGIWERKRRHEAVDPMGSWTEFGPRTAQGIEAGTGETA